MIDAMSLLMYQKSINTALGSSLAYVKCGSALWGRLMVNSSQITAQICNNLQKSVTKLQWPLQDRCDLGQDVTKFHQGANVNILTQHQAY